MAVIIDGTLGITSVNGSAAAPSVTGTDTDTGIVYGTNTLSLATGGTTAVTVDSSQNVGIGTSSPQATLAVQAATSGGSTIALQNTGTNPTAETRLGILGFGNTAAPSKARVISHTDGNWTDASSTPSRLTFWTTPSGSTTVTERMRIDSSGNVGIGTSSPSKKLEVGALGAFRLQTGSTTLDCTPTAGATDGFVWNTSAASYYDWAYAGSVKMRIDSSGYLKASNTGAYEGGAYNEINGSGEYGLVVVGRAASSRTAVGYFRATTSNAYGNLLQGVNGATTTFQVLASGNVQNTNNSYGAISDAKLKENITDATPKLNGLMQVRIVNYNLIGDTNKQLGVVAQELEQVFPSMIEESPDYENVVTTDEDGNEKTEPVATGTTTKAVKYSVFVPMLIKAIQEQQAIIEQLKADVAELKAAK